MGNRCKERGFKRDRALVLAGARSAAVVIGAFCLFLLADVDLPVSAHSVQLHAYVAGERCFVQGLFNGTEPASHARIEVFDGEGNRLLEGKTDGKGAFSFPISERTALDIVLTTPLGHRGQTRVGPVDTGDGAAMSGRTASATASDHGHAHPEELHAQEDSSPMVVLSQEELEALLNRTIEEALEEELIPLNEMIARMEEGRTKVVPRLLSGIGYIAGIFGLAMYLSSRRNQG